MNWSFRLGRIRGTEIKVHWTFLLLVGWYAWDGYQGGGPGAAVGSVVFLLALFTCVVLHEFGHITMAGHFGVRTPDVLILPIGGVARLERIPEEPRQELLIALAGPAVTLTIAAALYGVTRLVGAPVDPAALDVADPPLLPGLMWVNVILLAFNLIPAFPMDGGRVLRALLSSRFGHVKATRLAARVGQAIAIAFAIWGLSGHPMLLLIALFVYLGAGSEAAMVERRSLGRGLTVHQMMVTRFETIPVHARLREASQLLLSTEQREFPVLDNSGRLEGLLTRDSLIRGLAERGPDATVAEAMVGGVATVTPDLSFERAFDLLRESRLPALPVVDGAGRMVGLMTLDNITDLLLVRRAQGAA